MSGVNRVFLIGNLGANPEVRATQGGQTVANLPSCRPPGDVISGRVEVGALLDNEGAP